MTVTVDTLHKLYISRIAYCCIYDCIVFLYCVSDELSAQCVGWLHTTSPRHSNSGLLLWFEYISEEQHHCMVWKRWEMRSVHTAGLTTVHIYVCVHLQPSLFITSHGKTWEMWQWQHWKTLYSACLWKVSIDVHFGRNADVPIQHRQLKASQ